MKKKLRSAFLLESLEARLLFSADMAPVPVDGGISGAENESGLKISLRPDNGGVQEAETEKQDRREVVFVDEAVDDFDQLIADLESQLEKGRRFNVVTLDSDHDGIAQISAYLSQQQDVAAVHILSHGADGDVFLGNSRLNSATLDGYAEAIEGWQQALSSDADLLFYGCNLAAGHDGQDLVNSLTLLTGADVAASDDVTGSTQLGGDWTLEYGKGEIETAVALNSETQQNWNGVLATFTVNTTADTVDANPGDGIAEDAAGNTSLRAAIMEANALAGADSITLSAGTYSVSIAGTGDDVTLTGDLDITSDLNITGMGAGVTVIDGDGLDRVFHINWTGNATISNLTIQNGGNVTHGGGIRVSGGGGGGQLNLENVIVRNNTASGNGGGIFVDGVVTLTNVEISGNTTSGTGGGLSNDEQATLTGVTISGNSAADGGGIYNSNQGNLLELTNVTVSGNTATANGGGIYTAELVKLTNVTLTSNLGGGGIYTTGGQGDVQLKNSILANNTGGNSNLPLTSLGYNIEDGNSAFTPIIGDQPNTDPSLGLLQNNDGFTQTHALLTGSPAIDPVGLSGAPLHDQRGFARDVTPDIGAFEYNVSNTAPTLTVAGAATVKEGEVYTLNLSASDPDSHTITSWTINWGDGTIETIPGNSSSVTHTYTQAGFTCNITVSATDVTGTYIHNDLFAGHYINDAGVYRIQGDWGAPPVEFATEGTLDKTIQPIIGLDGNLYVSGESSRNVLRYNPETSAFIDVFANIPGEAGGIAFGPDGNLYVADYTNGEILRFNGSDGSAMGAFVTGIGGNPYSLTFGPDGNLYVALYDNAEVLKFDGLSGTALGTFISAGAGGLGTPEQIVFGPDGNLYIADVTNNSVLRFNGADGTPMGDFVADSEPHLDKPNGLAFGPDGNLYVSDSQDGVILRFDGSTGAFIDEYADGLDKPSLLAFAPDLQVHVVANAPPTFSSFIGPVTSGNEDSEITVTFGDLAVQGDENDADGTVDAFVVQTISSGTLRIGATAGSATAWAAGTNDTIDTSNNAYWTPDLDATGIQNAFEVVAKDDGGLESTPNVTATVSVTALNDAPILDPSGTMTLTDVLENNSDPSGNSVAAIISSATGDRITDVDSGAVEGIAVIGVDDSNGTWEYSLNSGASWNSFVAQGVSSGTTDDTAAVLLNDAALVRFVPNLGHTGTSGNLTFRAWDQTSGAAGDVGVDASTNGDPTAFSSATETATLTVVPAAGVLTLVPGAQITDEDTSLVFSAANGNAITVDDGTAGDPVLRAELSVTNGILTLNTTAGLSFESGADGTSSMTITGLESAINTALDGLSFTPAGDYNGPANLQITVDLQANLLARYTFDNPNPPDLGNDDSPTGTNDGTVVNATAAVDGTRGNVLSLDAAGGADYVQIAGQFGNPTNVTLAAWVNPTSAPIFGAEVITLGANVGLRVDDLGDLKGFMHDGSGWQIVTYATTLAGTGWHHVAYTFDDAGNVQKLYLDGLEVNSVAEGGSISYTQGSNSFIGKHGDGSTVHDYTGKIDDVRIYDRVLTDSEIANLFAETTAAAGNVSISVQPVNDAPVINDATFNIDEISTNGTAVGTVPVTDPDAGDTHVYSITAGNTGGAFAIDNSGNITVANSSALNFETTPVFTLTFQVQDQGGTGLTDTATVTVNLNDINDAPVINNSTFSVDENAANGTLVGTVAATDSGPADNYTMLYWVDVQTDELRRINLDGTGNEQLANQADGTVATGMRSVAVDDVNGKVYWVNNNSDQIWRANLDGSSPEQILSGIVWPMGIAVDAAGEKIYWFDNNSRELWWADLDGANAAALITAGINHPKALTIDAIGGKLYWTDWGLKTIMRADLDGSNLETVVAGLDDPYGSALDTLAGKVYWAEATLGEIQRADMVVGATAETVITGLSEPRAVTVDTINGKLYYADAGVDRIERANLDGSAIEIVTATGDWPTGLAIGPPVQNLNYAIIGGNINGAFTIDSVTGAITVANSSELDFETTPVFDLIVTVTDAGGLADSATITINLNNLNETPVINNATFSLDENSTNGTTVGNVPVTDPDAGDTHVYSITAGNTGGAFTIDNSGNITVANSAALNFETSPVVTLTVQVRDQGGTELTDTATITINVSDVATTITAGQIFGVSEIATNGSAVGTVVATGDAPTAFNITAGNTGNAFTIDASGNITVSDATAINYETLTSYTLTVEVNDGTSTTSETVTVNVSDVATTITAGQTFGVSETAINGTAVGTVATTGDAPTNFTIMAGNTGNAFAIDASGNITVNDATAINYESLNNYTLSIEVNDGTSITSETVTVNVSDVATTIAAGQTFGVSETATNGTAVGSVVTTGDAPTIFTITGGNTGNAFAINASGDITVNDATAINYETLNIYTLTVEVNDGTSTTSETVTVNVIDAATTIAAGQTFGVSETATNGTAVGSVVTTGDTPTAFNITGGNTGNAFTIDASGNITVNDATAINFETLTSYTLTVEVNDGTNTTSETVTVNVTDVNETPVINDATFNVDENSTNGTAVGNLPVTDPDAGDTHVYSITAGNTGGAFAINSAGNITVANSAALNFESTPVFTLTAQVQDQGGTGLTDTATVTVNLNDLNEAPVINDATFNVDENSTNGTAVGNVPVTDPDAGDTYVYSITAGNTGGAFAIDDAGNITVANTSALNFETTPVFTLTVQVQDKGGTGLNDTATVTVNLNDLNETPVINNATFNVDENSANGTAVDNVPVTDLDAGDTHVYSITAGNTGGAFAIDNAGNITVANSLALNFETTPVFTLTVQVQDQGGTGLTNTATITVNLNDMNDAGTVTIDNTTPTQGDTLTANVIDPDGASGAITYQWFSDAVAIGGATGKTYTTTQADVGTGITVTAVYTDDLGTAESLTSAGTAPVTNVNEAPVALNDNLNAAEDQSITFTSITDLLNNDSDVDGDALTISGFTQPANGMLVDNGDGTFTYNPAGNFNGIDSFTYTISDGNGGTATGTAIIAVTPVGDTPQATNVFTNAEVQSGLIFLNRNASDGPEVSHFKISGITNGTLYFADGVTPIVDGDFITVSQGQAGLRFTPAMDSTADGSFNIESSEDGISVTTQSGVATSNITVLTSAPLPSASEHSPPLAEPEEVIDEEIVEEDEALEEVVDETDVQADAGNIFSVETPQTFKAPGIAKPAFNPGLSFLNRADSDTDDDKTPDRSPLLSPKTLKMLLEAENLGELKTALGKLDITTLPPDVYELVRGSLDAVKEEMGKEILIGKTVLGSAIAASVGLSAGYVVWMLKGGSLLASVLSSLPAWQLADPLAILVGKKEDEDDDDESLETIIKDGSGRNEDKESKDSDLDNLRKESAKR